MPMSNIYGTSTDVESDESLPPLMDPSRHYVDPWDLENYAYLKEHLDSSELPSDPTSLGDFVEAQSSFDYVPVINQRNYIDTFTTAKYESVMTDHGTYACIDEIGLYEKTRPQSDILYEVAPRRNFHHGRHSEVKHPVHHQGSLIHHYEKNRNRKNPPPTRKNGNRDRSLSFAYGDGYETYGPKQGIYSRLEERFNKKEDIYYPIYDSPRNAKKPNNFGLSNYGHLKIDYSYSWNNLDKYIIG